MNINNNFSINEKLRSKNKDLFNLRIRIYPGETYIDRLNTPTFKKITNTEKNVEMVNIRDRIFPGETYLDRINTPVIGETYLPLS